MESVAHDLVSASVNEQGSPPRSACCHQVSAGGEPTRSFLPISLFPFVMLKKCSGDQTLDAARSNLNPGSIFRPSSSIRVMVHEGKSGSGCEHHAVCSGQWSACVLHLYSVQGGDQVRAGEADIFIQGRVLSDVDCSSSSSKEKHTRKPFLSRGHDETVLVSTLVQADA